MNRSIGDKKSPEIKQISGLFYAGRWKLEVIFMFLESI